MKEDTGTDDSRNSRWLKHMGAGPVLNYAVGDIPGGAVFKVAAEQAEQMLKSDMFRPATQDEVKGALAAQGAQQNGATAAAQDGSGRKKKKVN